MTTSIVRSRPASDCAERARVLPGLLLLASLCAAPAAFAAPVPLTMEIPFEAANPKADQAVTLVASPEVQNLELTKKRGLNKFHFPIGPAVVSNLQRALESRYAEVGRADALDEAAPGLVVEVLSVDVEPDLPATTFGPYKAVVTLTLAIHRDGEPEQLVITKEGSNKKHAARVVFQTTVGAMKANWVQTGRATDVAIAEAADELLATLGSAAP